MPVCPPGDAEALSGPLAGVVAGAEGPAPPPPLLLPPPALADVLRANAGVPHPLSVDSLRLTCDMLDGMRVQAVRRDPSLRVGGSASGAGFQLLSSDSLLAWAQDAGVRNGNGTALKPEGLGKLLSAVFRVAGGIGDFGPARDTARKSGVPRASYYPLVSLVVASTGPGSSGLQHRRLPPAGAASVDDPQAQPAAASASAGSASPTGTSAIDTRAP